MAKRAATHAQLVGAGLCHEAFPTKKRKGTGTKEPKGSEALDTLL